MDATIHLIRQSHRALFRALTAERTAIVLVRAGMKRVDGIEIPAGSLGILPGYKPLTIENLPPDREGAVYEASALVLAEGGFDRMRAAGWSGGDPTRVTDHDRAIAAFERAAAAADDPLTPDALREHAVDEVLLWLVEEGIGPGPARPAGLADRLGSLVASDPAARWTAAEAARALAVGEATLRRHLAREGTSFGDVLIDRRMTHALSLLQTTELPVDRIALDVGYASASRFAVRFRARFGIAPSAIRRREAGQGLPRLRTIGSAR